jgi:hypothetical protein
MGIRKQVSFEQVNTWILEHGPLLLDRGLDDVWREAVADQVHECVSGGHVPAGTGSLRVFRAFPAGSGPDGGHLVKDTQVDKLVFVC